MSETSETSKTSDCFSSHSCRRGCHRRMWAAVKLKYKLKRNLTERARHLWKQARNQIDWNFWHRPTDHHFCSFRVAIKVHKHFRKTWHKSYMTHREAVHVGTLPIYFPASFVRGWEAVQKFKSKQMCQQKELTIHRNWKSPVSSCQVLLEDKHHSPLSLVIDVFTDAKNFALTKWCKSLTYRDGTVFRRFLWGWCAMMSIDKNARKPDMLMLERKLVVSKTRLRRVPRARKSSRVQTPEHRKWSDKIQIEHSSVTVVHAKESIASFVKPDEG